MPETISLSPNARIAGFIYLLTAMIAFPAFLAAVQDFPSLPRLRLERYLEPADLRHFHFEVLFLGGCFIAIFIAPLSREFAEIAGLKFRTIVFLTAIMAYAAGILLIEKIYPASTAVSRSRYVCQDGRQICYAFGIHAYLMFVALASGLTIARVLRLRLVQHEHAKGSMS